MAKRSKRDYVQANKRYLAEIAAREGVEQLNGGVLFQLLERGTGTKSPGMADVVTVNYKGWLIDGTVFDSSEDAVCPQAFRLRDVIAGWQVALMQMREGDKAQVWIPYAMGYGDKHTDGIPGSSTLIFEVELLAVN